MSPERATILACLRGQSGPLGPGEIARRTGISPGSVRHLLTRMAERAQVLKVGPGLYAAPSDLQLVLANRRLEFEGLAAAHHGSLAASLAAVANAIRGAICVQSGEPATHMSAEGLGGRDLGWTAIPDGAGGSAPPSTSASAAHR